MKEAKEKERKIEDWLTVPERFPDAEGFYIIKIKGMIGGEPFTSDAIFWLDSKEEIAMTKDEIFRLGKPNKTWLKNIMSRGNKLSDADIKGSMH